MEFRSYQKEIITKGVSILNKHSFLYLAMQVRTGKTLTSLGIAEAMGCRNLLFITKKKAISSIDDDVTKLCPSYVTFIRNYESLHKLPEDVRFDFIIVDEAHSTGAYPKPSGRAKKVANLIRKHRPLVILMSGTPTPESYSQMYHQVYGIPGNPFKNFRNFYRFADVYVNKKQRMINGRTINNYDDGKMDIVNKMKPYTINYTQQEAGFDSVVEEEVLWIRPNPIIEEYVKELKKDFVINIDDKYVLADTSVKLMQKTHQLYSGTVKFEDKSSTVIDTSKAEFIKDYFKDKKIGIFYKFKAELDALKMVFGDKLCTEIHEFDTTDKNIALQIVSGREGTKLSKAENLIFYNIDFSATSYWQARDRMTTKDRKHNKIFWIFSIGGIEQDVYKSVTKKKDYTLKHFRRDFLDL